MVIVSRFWAMATSDLFIANGENESVAVPTSSELAILLEATLIVDLTLTCTLIIQHSTLIFNNYC